MEQFRQTLGGIPHWIAHQRGIRPDTVIPMRQRGPRRPHLQIRPEHPVSLDAGGPNSNGRLRSSLSPKVSSEQNSCSSNKHPMNSSEHLLLESRVKQKLADSLPQPRASAVEPSWPTTPKRQFVTCYWPASRTLTLEEKPYARKTFRLCP